MSLLAATILTAWATVVLAVFAIVTAWFAWRAYRKQSREVAVIERQVTDQQELTRQQAEQLKVQTSQLGLQQRQFEQQQADRHSDQASRIFITSEITEDPMRGATVRERAKQARRAMEQPEHQKAMGEPNYQTLNVQVTNTSQQPVYDLHINWRKGTAPWAQPERVPVLSPGAELKFARPLPDDLTPSVDRSLFSAVVIFRDRNQVWWRTRPDGRSEELGPGEEPPHSW